jgi:excinuclease ABC subunit C
MSDAEQPEGVAPLILREREGSPGSPQAFGSPEAFVEQFDLARVPARPGCYLMQDATGKVVYVGKANNLRSRIRAYINEQDSRYRVKFLMRKVARIDFLVTTNDKEALLLENSLIKQHAPRYNVQLKDDKTYVRLRLNLQHEFPRLTVTRSVRKDGARYFGPYASADAVRTTMRQLQRLFPLRTCSDQVLRNRSRPCLYYQMGQCAAPCVGYVDREQYRETVDQVVLALEGRSDELEKQLRAQMQELSDRLEFEEAAKVRDRLRALEATLERQRTVQAFGEEDRDVWGVHTHGRFCEVQVLFYRRGKMTGGRSFSFNQREMPLEDLLSSFVLQYYSEASGVPREVLVPAELEDAEALASLLGEARGGRVVVHHPQRGEKRALVDLANRNAESSFEEKRLADQANADLLEQVRAVLDLAAVPERIECFDISTTQGAKPVGAMVAFTRGEPDKARYRRFSIKQVEGQDDFAMMREVLLRRYRRAIDEGDLPDLVLIDGGKGQLNVASAVLEDLGIDDLEVASIAKSRPEENARSPERFFRPGRKNAIAPPQNHPAVLYLARVRDECHRFAITYHRSRRGKTLRHTALHEIPGVGPKRARTLLSKLGSVARVREAPISAIATLPGFSERLAQTVKDHLARESGISKGGKT